MRRAESDEDLRPQRGLIVLCGAMIVIAARCLRIGYVNAHQLPAYSTRYVIAVHAWFIASFALIIAALVLTRPRLPVLRELTLRPHHTAVAVLKPGSRLHSVWRVIVRFAPYVVVAIIIGQKIYDRYGVQYIGSDGALFSRYAVDLALDGKNPYAESMQPAFAIYSFDAPSTYRVDGTAVAQVSYPAMSFLPFVPQALTGSKTIDLTSLVVLAVTFFWLIAKSDGVLRCVPPILLLVHPDLVNFTAGGVFDILWVLPVLIAMQQWSRGHLTLAGAAYGIACSVKQTPWFIAPFLAVALLLDNSELDDFIEPRAKRFMKFAGAAAATFVVTNLPFMITAPGPWLAGVMTPVVGGPSLVESGEGPVLYNIIGAAHEPKAFFSLLMVTAFAVFMWYYTVYYPRTKWLAWIAPMVVLWFNYRSLHNYYLFSIPIAHFALVLRANVPCPEWSRPRLTALTPIPLVGAVLVTAIAAVAFSSRVVLAAKVSLIESQDLHDLDRISRIRVHLENRAAQPMTPIFQLTQAQYETAFFWRVDEGPRALAAGSAADYTLIAPSVQATVPIGVSMHIRVYDSGHDAWASLVVAPDPDEKHSHPLIKNPSFVASMRRPESGLYIPVQWTTTPRHPKPWMHVSVADDGIHLATTANAEASATRGIALTQTLEALPSRLMLDVTPLTVKASTDSNEASGFELRGGRRCVVLHLSDVSTTSVHSGERDERDCRFIEVPAKAGERLTTTITLADYVDPAFIDAMKGRVRLMLFPGRSESSDSAVIFHLLASDTVTYALRQR